jgi:GTPase SAR1 family protein
MDTEEIDVEELSDEMLFPKNLILVIGESGSGKSCTVKKLVERISTTYSYGIICTDTKHCKEFYTGFIEPENLYSRYASILIKRCFYDYTWLVLDNIHYNKGKFDEIIGASANKNNIVIFTSKVVLKYNFDFIVICGIPKKSKEIFDYYLDEIQEFEFEDFSEILEDFSEQKENSLVIKLGDNVEFFYI